MKIAFLFSGQLRQIPKDVFQNSLSILTKGLTDYSIFAYCWQEEGKSLDHKKNLPLINLRGNIDESIKELFQDFNLEKYGIESFQDFNKNLPEDYKEILNSNKFHFGTINSLPQIYTLYKSYQLLENSNCDFDLIFRCRFDSIFIHPLKLFPLKIILENNFLYNINFGRAYYPKRIYDIFFGGSQKSMRFIKNIWSDAIDLTNNEFNNGLDKRDCCRLLYLASIHKDVKVKSFSSRICDVYRNNDYLYADYLISSHIVKFPFNRNDFRILNLFFKWLKYREIFNFRITIKFLKSFIYFPFVYLKRIKYFKNFLNSY